jgi:hypothetical protein
VLATDPETRELASGQVISRIRVTGIAINPDITARAFMPTAR